MHITNLDRLNAFLASALERLIEGMPYIGSCVFDLHAQSKSTSSEPPSSMVIFCATMQTQEQAVIMGKAVMETMNKVMIDLGYKSKELIIETGERRKSGESIH